MSKTLKCDRMPRYSDGERECPICNKPLPAHQDWAGGPLRSCGSDECLAGIKKLSFGRYVEGGTTKCQVVNCSNLIPEGRYRRNNSLLCCSSKCWWHLTKQGTRINTCHCGCGTPFHRHVKKADIGKPMFLDAEHWGKHCREQFAQQHVGIYTEIFNEYLSFCEARGMRAIGQIRAGLYPLFVYLNEIGITDLNSVKPATINRYLIWAKKNDRKSVPAQISTVTTFFDWLIMEEHLESSNPVKKKFHSKPPVHRRPRPLRGEEENLLWEILESEDSPMLRLAAAIGEEAGLRATEVCNVRLTDMFLKEQKILVRTPNKGMKERWGHFGEKTKRYYLEWMAVRRTDIEHDGLLHNRYGGRLKYGALRDEYLRTLSKVVRGTRGSETGFDRWLTHRLRHTFATNLAKGGAEAMTIAGLGGWDSMSAMEGYIETTDEKVAEGYRIAMTNAKEQKETPNTNRIFTLAEALERKRSQQDAKLPRTKIVA